MRKIVLAGSFWLASVMCIWAQAPQQMSYQAVIRDVSGTLVSNSSVAMKVSILQGSSGGPVVFSETHTGTTNTNGLFTTQIGAGSLLSGNFSTIAWGNGPYFLKTESDPAGGTNYSVVATTQLLSVPYALYAETSGSVANTAFLYLEKKATGQTIPSGSSTGYPIINYDTISTNGLSFNNPTGTITFNQNGIYIINASTSFGGTQPGRKAIFFECVSAKWPARIAMQELADDARRGTTSFVGEFNAGDTLIFYVAQYTGVSVDSPNTTLAADETLINIERIR